MSAEGIQNCIQCGGNRHTGTGKNGQRSCGLAGLCRTGSRSLITGSKLLQGDALQGISHAITSQAEKPSYFLGSIRDQLRGQIQRGTHRPGASRRSRGIFRCSSQYLRRRNGSHDLLRSVVQASCLIGQVFILF